MNIINETSKGSILDILLPRDCESHCYTLGNTPRCFFQCSSRGKF